MQHLSVKTYFEAIEVGQPTTASISPHLAPRRIFGAKQS